MQQLVAQLPWGHNTRLLDALNSPAEREWYARATIEQGWSRNVLTHQISTNLMGRQGSALSNFTRTLPAEQSELAQQVVKDPYSFDFLSLGTDLRERDLERGLIEHLQSMLFELGKGFAFVGRQHHLQVGDQDYYLDLLFYHLRLRCFVVIELKIEDFKPEFAGKMNFYLSAVDEQLRHSDDQPSIGIILCQQRNEMIVEYALRDTAKPMGVAQYLVSHALPEPLKHELPTAEDWSKEFPAMVLVGLRIKLEEALNTKLRSLDESSNRPASLLATVEELRSRGTLLPSADQLPDAVHLMNRAIHGDDIETEAAEHAATVARQFLHEIEESDL